MRLPIRVAAVAAGVGLCALSAGAVSAVNLPPVPPVPSIPPVPNPGLPQSGQTILFLFEAPSVFIASIPPPPGGCIAQISYDNSQARPPGTTFRGETTCGGDVFYPVMSGQVILKNSLGNVVAWGNPFGPETGNGPDVSEGRYGAEGMGGILQGGTSGTGPVPGLTYSITFTSSITLPLQYWGPPGQGCTLSNNGQTLTCVNTTTYMYLPGTKGGFQP